MNWGCMYGCEGVGMLVWMRGYVGVGRRVKV